MSLVALAPQSSTDIVPVDIESTCPTHKFALVSDFDWDSISVDPTRHSSTREDKRRDKKGPPAYTLFATNPFGKQRAWVVRNVKLLYDIKPSSVPDDAPTKIIDNKTVVEGRFWNATDKLGAVFEVTDPASIEGLERGTVRAAVALFEKKEKFFSSDQLSRRGGSGISSPADIEQKFATRLTKTVIKEDGRTVHELHTHVSGWADTIAAATIATKQWAGGEFDSVVSVRYNAVESKPASATIFVLRLRDEEGKVIGYRKSIPLRTDGTIDSKAPFQYDSKGRLMWRRVGPQDVTRGSVGDAIVDFVGYNMGANPALKKNVLFYVFDRAPPSKSVNELETWNEQIKDAPEEDEVLMKCLEAMQAQSDRDEQPVQSWVLALEDGSVAATPLAGSKRGRLEDAEESSVVPLAPRKSRDRAPAFTNVSHPEVLDGEYTV